MSAQTYFLAHSRLAPVQATAWGHPDTTGLSTLDYFVSCDAIEPPGAEDEYTERLIRLGRLPAIYDVPEPPPALRREQLRLPETGALYGCPQSLFKFHPDFDAVLAQIAAGDPDGHIVLIAADAPAWTEVLRERWARTHPVLLDRVNVPAPPRPRGLHGPPRADRRAARPHALRQRQHALRGAGAGDADRHLAGRFARGRIVAGAYAQMGVDDPPVAPTPGDYAAIAVALGRDPARRERLRAELIEKGRAQLYADSGAAREFEAFLEAAVAAAADTRLPSGWSPDR